MKNLDLKNKKIAVIGLGVEGRDLVKFLTNKGIKVDIFDKKDKKHLDLSDIDGKRTKFLLGEKYKLDGLGKYDIIFRSPGVYRYLPELVKAQKGGTQISSAVKLFLSLSPAKIIGVTGTKGKGTTATLIYKILKQSGKKTYLAGNIGKPCLSLLSSLDKESWVVLELSSFQLIDIKKSPHVSVVLNITQDHLNWHKDIEEYVGAKENVVKYQTRKDFAVINKDYETSKNFSELTKAKTFFFSKRKNVDGCYVRDGKIFLSTKGDDNLIGESKDLLLKGVHNLENITAAACTSSLAGADLTSIKKQIFSFKGLEHRLELVKKVGGVVFYNDSFATGPQPTIAAINAFSKPLTIILGGSRKELDYKRLGKEVAKKDNIQNIVLIGQVADKIKDSIKKSGYKGKILELRQAGMDQIVKTSFRVTPKGGFVLLSPAAASFDMFKDYKDRGKRFKKEVEKLKK